MTTLAEQLSSYACGLRYDDLPEDTVHLAKRFIIDTLGCALGGYSSEPARVAREMAGMVSSTEPATVLGSGGQSSLDLPQQILLVVAQFNHDLKLSGIGH